jgi:hypothetical protein
MISSAHPRLVSDCHAPSIVIRCSVHELIHGPSLLAHSMIHVHICHSDGTYQLELAQSSARSIARDSRVRERTSANEEE